MASPVNMTDLDDHVLWECYRQGDEMAFSELFRRYYKKLAYYGLKFTHDVQEIEDVIQELMMRLWSKRDAVNATESVKFYLLKAFRHQLFRKLQRPASQTEITEDLFNTFEEMSSEQEFIKNESETLLQQRIQHVLGHLTPRQREIIYLRFYQNLTPPEIGALLSINAQSVSNIIQRSFIKIRESISNVTFTLPVIFSFIRAFFTTI